MLISRKFCLHLLVAIGIIFTAANGAVAVNSTNESIAFFYGTNPPVNALSQFDRLVVESENMRPSDLTGLKQHGSAAYAYLSIGEVGPHRSWANLIQPKWIIGVNTGWNSNVMDLTNTGWQRFIIDRVDNLVQQGYDGLFLDTMDSYQLFATDAASKAAQEAALANLIYQIKSRHPSIRLISNRGFEVMDKVATYLEAVAAESLFSRWNNESKAYDEVPVSDRQWLTAKLVEVKSKYNLDIIAIDYVSPADRSTARDVAKKISALGFIPWVANPSLDYVGISNLEVIPREVLMLFDTEVNGSIESAEVHTLLAVPLEYMGYVPIYHDLTEKGIPQGILKGAYAGVVMWNQAKVDHPGYTEWFNKQLDDQLPMAILGSIGTELTQNLSVKLGIKSVNEVDPLSLQSDSNSPMIGFEAPVPTRIDQYSMSIINKDDSSNRSHLRFKDKRDNRIDTVITGPWGGLALHPTIIDRGINELENWIIDPFAFLKTSLHLIDAPMPDITSENGTRLWFAHIDGDAMPSWAELPGRHLGSEIIRDYIIKEYELPHTISVVEAEMYTPDRRARMEKTARDLFELDYVEIATHTYSHPFKWQKIKQGATSGKYNLKIDDYLFSLDREIGGSAQYIDNNLAPPGKKTKVMLWSGDAVPLAEAIATAEKYGLMNMNGGFTTISKMHPTIVAISPNVRTIGGYTQVYAPIMNENIYTNEWLGPFDGFRRVIETLEMTGYPRRIKPVNIYYHFYAGTKKAALRSLEEIYDWSMDNDLLPILSSEYIIKVPNYRTAGVAQHLDGRWKVSGLGNIRSLRTLKKNSWPDLTSSNQLLGTNMTHDATYIHTTGANTVSFNMTSQRPQLPHLVSANAIVNHWEKRSSNSFRVSFSGDLPVHFTLNGDKTQCNVSHKGSSVRGQVTTEGDTRFNFTTKETGDVVINC